MANKPRHSVSVKGITISIWDNPNGKLSISLPTKRYDKNQTWKKENKHLKPEWVESKSLFENEIDSLLECVQKVKDYLGGKVEAQYSFDEDDIGF